MVRTIGEFLHRVLGAQGRSSLTRSPLCSVASVNYLGLTFWLMLLEVIAWFRISSPIQKFLHKWFLVAIRYAKTHYYTRFKHGLKSCILCNMVNLRLLHVNPIMGIKTYYYMVVNPYILSDILGQPSWPRRKRRSRWARWPCWSMVSSINVRKARGTAHVPGTGDVAVVFAYYWSKVAVVFFVFAVRQSIIERCFKLVPSVADLRVTRNERSFCLFKRCYVFFRCSWVQQFTIDSGGHACINARVFPLRCGRVKPLAIVKFPSICCSVEALKALTKIITSWSENINRCAMLIHFLYVLILPLGQS